MSREIVLAIEIHAEPKQVFDTIASRAGLASFWTPDVQGDDHEGGDLTFGFEQAPTRLSMHITELQVPALVGWRCDADWPFWGATTVSWATEPSEHGTKVTFRHIGWADGTPDYALGSVALTWALILARLKDVVESGTSDPVLR